jgi:release factor glutamine methyltransferase
VRREPLGEVRERYREAALERGISPRDVDLLLGDLLGRSLAWLVAHGDDEIDPTPLAAMMERRFSGEPVQYIRGRTEFYSRQFLVDPRVLIPRPETELLVETAVALAPREGRVIDVGTGSGCIAISIERSRPDLQVAGADVSFDALLVAAANRRRLESNVRLVNSDVLSAFRGQADLIVSNPPYIPAAEVDGLAAEVRLFEPRLALTPGPAGTEVIERILDGARPLLASRGRVILEIGYGQLPSMRKVARKARYTIEQVKPDLAGIDRVVVLSRRER